jgi:adenine-specific DNA-methyltransferase
MSTYDELVNKLQEIFQIDRPDLDFGVYRILNARAKEIGQYLQNDLKAKVKSSLSTASDANREHLQQELADAVRTAESLDMPADSVPKVKDLKARLASMSGDTSEHEHAVFSHLLTFFARYYDKGDFISQRRYKGDTYAIPYAGEEVMLHWANKDQYYTKSSENFSNYSFALSDGRKVHFHLVSADTAKDNRKDNGQERRFVLCEARTSTRTDDDGSEIETDLKPVVSMDQELLLHFEYKAMPKSKQEELNGKAVDAILADPIVKSKWLDLARREPTDKQPNRTLLAKHFSNYTEKNSSDYFIHKDLGGFLRRELDFYIKNEVMHLDDLQNAQAITDIEKNLRQIQCIRSIGLDLIDFLAQLENFQKKLWLKKKFVVATHYCITLDRIPQDLYADIAANPRQWEQWKGLGMIAEAKAGELELHGNVGTVEYLQGYPFLMVDTALYTLDFKAKLLAGMDNLDDQCDGLLIHGDNFQALNLLQERYREQVKCVYIDPPYNTSASEIIYKNSYKHSSWLSFIYNTLILSKTTMNRENGTICGTIDDVEYKNFGLLFELVFGEVTGSVSIRIKPSGRPIPNGFAISHEYALFAKSNISYPIARLNHSEEQIARYRETDEKGPFFWEMFRKAGSNSNRSNRPTMYYPFCYDKNSQKIRILSMEYSEITGDYQLLEQPRVDEILVYPKKDDGTDGCWYFGLDRARLLVNEFKAIEQTDGSRWIYYRRRPNDGIQPTTVWFDSKYSATEHGTALLKNLFGEQEVFSYPKSIHAVVDCLTVSGLEESSNGLTLDYFAGSGTTGHAVINLNRQDQGKRKYILVEQGEYFDTVTKPRIQKVVYSDQWKEGKASTHQNGISHAFKVIQLESYEDTLNNLQLSRTKGQQELLDQMPAKVREDYLLRYMLEFESRAHLLGVDQFRKPFDCKLRVAIDSAGAMEERTIDLVETFNYLIGLRIKSVDTKRDKGIAWVEGTLPSGEKTLVLWRDCETVGYEELNRYCESRKINPHDTEFQVIYVNGDHNIPAVLTKTASEGGLTQSLKLRQIEPEFLSRMFDVEGV